MSDLHLERIRYGPDESIPRVAPYLVFAGDVGRFCDYEQYKCFLNKQCAVFDRVFLVAGNHEFYGSSRDEGLDAAARLIAEPEADGKLTFMNRAKYDVPDTNIVILGCTLHSYIGPNYTRLTNDFARIKGWTVEHHNAEHQADRNWLESTLTNIAATDPDKQVVIVTHYAPAFVRTSHPKNENSAVSPCFCSDTLETFSQWKGASLVTHWIFGHTHWNARFRSGITTVLSNCFCNDARNLSWLQKQIWYRAFDAEATITVP